MRESRLDNCLLGTRPSNEYKQQFGPRVPGRCGFHFSFPPPSTPPLPQTTRVCIVVVNLPLLIFLFARLLLC